MRNTLTRCILLAGTSAFAIGCGHDDASLPTTTQLSADSLAIAKLSFNAPTSLDITPNTVAALAIGGTAQLSARVTNPIGATLTTTVLWTSSNAAVATVAANGLVSSKGAGTAIIRGNPQSYPTVGDSVIIVVNGVSTPPASVKSITVALSSASLAPAATAQATATLKDSLGQVLTGRTVTWLSTAPTVATVNATTGVVTAVAAGTSTITATNGNVTGSATVTVTAASAASVKSITVALSNTSITTLTSSQATATLKDSLGRVLTGRTVTWTSASPLIALVNATTGVVTGLLPGTSVITATSGTVKGTATITVTLPIPQVPTGNEVLANLPQVYLNTTMPASPAAGGKIINVAAGGNLQSAINSAQPGDVIALANGATFTGNFTLPKKSAATTNWIVIRPASMAGVPAEGVRMTPSKASAANLPKVISSSNQGAFNTDIGAHHFRIVAIEVSVPATINNTGLIRLGTSYEKTLAEMPHDLVLDRMYIHGTATGNNRRCVVLNGASTAVIDSYISDCHDTNVDAQAIAGWSGPGPFKIVNNYLEASTENINWGGGDPIVQGLIPSDIEIRRNHFFKPTSWKGKWLVKNLFEIKNAQRVLVEGNIFENNWQDGQGGSAINLKSVNQDGGCRWCVAKDITFRLNLIKNTGSGFALSGYDQLPPMGPQSMTRVTITNNIVTGIDAGPTFNGDGRGFLINNAPVDLVITHNTVPDATNMAITFGGPVTELPIRLVIRDNLMGGGQYGVKGPGMATNTALALFLAGGWRGNALILGPGNTTGYPTGTLFASTLAAVGFVSPSALDFHLSTSSPLRLKATDGRDPGADVNAVNSAIAGVIVP